MAEAKKVGPSPIPESKPSILKQHYLIMNYYVYIISNPSKSILYSGVTNCLQTRLYELHQQAGCFSTFCGRWHVNNLLYWEGYKNPQEAISREKQISAWTRARKEALIAIHNPNKNFIDLKMTA